MPFRGVPCGFARQGVAVIRCVCVVVVLVPQGRGKGRGRGRGSGRVGGRVGVCKVRGGVGVRVEGVARVRVVV